MGIGEPTFKEVTPEGEKMYADHKDAIESLQQDANYYEKLGFTDAEVKMIMENTTETQRLEITITADGDQKYEKDLYNEIIEGAKEKGEQFNQSL